MSLSLVAAALLGKTACTSYPGSDEIAAEYYAQVRAEAASEQPLPSDAEQPPESAAEEPATEQTPSDTAAPEVSTPQAGTEYFQANQRFSPVLDKWVIDGTSASFKQYSCTGSVTAEGNGTLEPAGSTGESFSLTWDPATTGVDMVGRQLEITDRYLSQAYGIDDGAAVTDKKAAAVKFTKMCGELGDTVLKILL